jgi:hypothetical protein
MRLSKFNELMNDEFGVEYSAVLLNDLVLGELGDVTGKHAIKDGVDPRAVWIAICRVNQVPQERWTGLNKLSKKQHAEEK